MAASVSADRQMFLISSDPVLRCLQLVNLPVHHYYLFPIHEYQLVRHCQCQEIWDPLKAQPKHQWLFLRPYYHRLHNAWWHHLVKGNANLFQKEIHIYFVVILLEAVITAWHPDIVLIQSVCWIVSWSKCLHHL